MPRSETNGKTTSEMVEQTLMTGLLRGELAPGTWIRQDVLADDLGVSKIPVREALQRLAMVGLLKFEANRGVVVPELTAAEAEENYALRQAVEPLLLKKSIPNMSIVDLAEAEVALSAAGQTVAERNWAFHRALYQPAGWVRGLAITEILQASVAPYVVLYTEELGGAPASDAEHDEILAACRAGDTQTASKVLRSHLTNAADVLVGFLNR